MELFLLKTFAFLRPLLSIDVEQKIAGMGVLDVAGIGLIAVLGVALSMRIAVSGQYVRFSSVDAWVIAYALWCVAMSLIYPDKTDFRELVKWVAPFVTYLVAGKILENRQQYLQMLMLVLIGHAIPIVLSTVAIFFELDLAIYAFVSAAKLVKYQGVYANSANMSLSMTLFIVSGVAYAAVTRSHLGETKKLKQSEVLLFSLGCLFALYCLFIGPTRTAQLGLIIFFATYYYQVNKKRLLVAGVVLGAIVVIMSPVLKLWYYDVIEPEQSKRPIEQTFASGRPYFWAHNLSLFAKASPDRWIAGVGIGNLTELGDFSRGDESFWSSHNDLLAVLIHTGVVGLLIFVGLQVVILKKILALEGPEKAAFLALFVATVAMNFGSNSFLSRFALAQLYFLLISYLELNHRGLRMSHSQQLRGDHHS